ncbi:hypothetical protein N8I77_001348 [Diaporthe amygdali]|uniref:Uncharacterized protein n=1 Tax=Phomopsis amygdali TaxID=1214568 RepID=A0AAD9W826_PHOAM|nr:uncharacterized protein J7T55_013147 [Diaporthe amygdali]KAJ0118891.1 hypothetical protein J7T55_013147 [Diaporthe amygdali]KAK2614537.1 hypothetical protein N8I77_001348 [Diaporthe amygdali]
MSPQRPFLSSFFAAFRQQPPPSMPQSSAQASSANKQPTSSTTTTSYSVSTTAPSTSRGIAAQAAAAAQSQSAAARGVTSPRGIPIPQQPRRRGSDSSTEGFREVLGADKMYIGGKTAAGEEKYFKLGMVRRVRSGDRLSIDRLSL